MSYDDVLTATVSGAVNEAIQPLLDRIDALEKLLTATGGERASDLLTKAQVAQRLKVTPRTVDRYVASGKLHAPIGTRNGKRWKVQDIRNFGGGF